MYKYTVSLCIFVAFILFGGENFAFYLRFAPLQVCILAYNNTCKIHSALADTENARSNEKELKTT